MFFSSSWFICLVGMAHFLEIAGQSEPKTMSKEWQEASNERAIEQKLNPISGTFLGFCFVSMSLITLRFLLLFFLLGIASEGYSGKGFVQSK